MRQPNCRARKRYVRDLVGRNYQCKEPWAFGYRYTAINKRAIELRYELLPYIYNVMEQASEAGTPALRPLFLEFPKDEHVAGINDEFLFGANLLVAPAKESELTLYEDDGDTLPTAG